VSCITISCGNAPCLYDNMDAGDIMAIDERELYFAHTLDVAWIIALWYWIHGGDPVHEGVTAQTTELMARALVGHLSDRKAEAPKDIIEKLGELGIKVTALCRCFSHSF